MIKILKLFDFKKCELPEKLFEIKIPQAKIDEKIEKAAEHFLTIEEQDGAVQNGDIAAVRIESPDSSIQSDCERFSVGKGFFYQEIDSEILGKQKGDSFSLKIGDVSAKITVLWVKRRVVPDFTDAMAAQMGIEDVANVREYTDYVTQELADEEKEKKQNGIWLLVSKKIIEESSFEMDAQEVEAQYKKDTDYLQNELGDDFEEFMQVKYHGKSLEESKQNFKKDIEKTLKLCAIAAPMAAEDGIEWSREEYEAVIDDMVSEDYSRDELEQSMSFDDYVKQQTEEYFKGKVLEYFDDRFSIEIVQGAV